MIVSPIKNNILSIFAFTSIIIYTTLATDIYVDNSYTSQGNGDFSSPFPSLKQAINYIMDDQTKQIKSDFINITIRIKFSSVPYLWESTNLQGPSKAILNVVGINSGKPSTDSTADPCTTLPVISISDDSFLYSTISGINTLSINSICFKPSYSNSIENGMVNVNTVYFLLSNVIINEDTSTMTTSQPRSGVTQLFNVSNTAIELKNFYGIRSLNYPWLSTQNSSISIQDSTLSFSTNELVLETTAFGFYNKGLTSYKTIITNFTIKCKDSTPVFFSTLFDIGNYSEIQLSKFNIASCSSLNLEGSVIKLTDNGFLNLSDINIVDSTIQAKFARLFAIQTVDGFNVDLFRMSNCLINTYNVSGTKETPVLFTIFDLYNGRKASNYTITNLKVVHNIAYNLQIGIFSGNISSIDVEVLHILNNTLSGVLLSYHKLLMFDSSFSAQKFPPLNSWNFFDVKLSTNILYDFQLILANYESSSLYSCLQISEFDECRIHSLEMVNNTLTRTENNLYLYNVRLIESRGYRMHFFKGNLTDNILTHYDFFHINTRISSVILQNATITNLQLKSSSLLRESFRDVTIACVDFSIYNYRKVADDPQIRYSIYATYRVTAVFDGVFQNLDLQSDSILIDSSNPYLFVFNNLFLNSVINDSSLLKFGGFSPIPLDSSQFIKYERNQDWEAKIFTTFYSNFNDTSFSSAQTLDEIIYQIKIVRNVFSGINQTNKNFIIITHYSFKGTAVILQENKIVDSRIIAANFFFADSVSHIELSQNFVTNLAGLGSILVIEDLENERFINVNNNTFTNLKGPSLLESSVDMCMNIWIIMNNISNSSFSRSAINIQILFLEENILIDSNKFIECISENDNSYINGILYLMVPACSYYSLIAFSNNMLMNLVLSQGLLSKKVFLDNLMTFLSSWSQVTISNCNFTNISSEQSGNPISINAKNVTITNCNFTNLTSSFPIGALYILAPNVNIISSLFLACKGDSSTFGGAIFIANDLNVDAELTFNMKDNVFKLNSANQGGLIYASNKKILWTSNNNDFIDNYGDSGSAIQFFNCTFHKLEVSNSRIEYNEEIAWTNDLNADFMLFDTCEGSMNMADSTITAAGFRKGTLFQIVNSSKMTVSISNVVILPINGAIKSDGLYQTSSSPNRRRMLDASNELSLSSLNLSFTNSSSSTVQLPEFNKIVPIFDSDKKALETLTFNSLTFLYTDSGVININRCKFRGSRLLDDALIYIACASNGESVNLTITDSSFNDMTFITKAVSTSLDSNVYDYVDLIGTIYVEKPAQCKININIESSDFSDMYSLGSGCVINDQSSGNLSLTVKDSVFKNLTSRLGPAINSLYSSNRSVIIIKNSTFTQNKALGYGGSIFSAYSRIDITQSRFFDNTARFAGGAIYSQNAENLGSIHKSNQNEFKNNSLKPPVQTNTNYTAHGKDIASDPYFIQISFENDSLKESGVQIKKDNLTITLSNITTYSLKKLKFEFKIKDAVGNTIKDYSTDAVVRMDFFVWPNIVHLAAGSDCQLNASSYYCTVTPVLVDMFGTTVGKDQNFKGNITITYFSQQINIVKVLNTEHRACLIGEVHDKNRETCKFCERGTFSVDPENSSCLVCPSGAECMGGNNVRVLPQFWRNVNSPNVRYCGDSTRCKGGYLPEDMCTEGFSGPLCLQCDTSNKTGAIYVPQSQVGQCGKCVGGARMYAYGFLLFMMTFCYELWLIWNTSKTNLDFYAELMKGERTANSGPYVRLLTTYYQIIRIVGTLEAGFTAFFGINDTLDDEITQINFSIECLLLDFNVDAANLFEYRLIIVATAPF